MNELSDFLKALAALLGAAAWPVAALLIARMFRKEIATLLGRIKKGKFAGQEFELEQQLNEAAISANAAESETALVRTEEKLPTANDTGGAVVTGNQNRVLVAVETDKFTREILEEASRSPKAALIQLAATIETEFRNLAASGGHTELVNKPVSQAVRSPVLSKRIPPSLLGSIDTFWAVRNKIVHGRVATDDDAIRAIDIGLTVLKAIQSIARERNEVRHPGVPVYSDADCKVQLDGVKGLILKTTSPGGVEVTYRIFPTTSNDYKTGEVLSWEWNKSRQWGKAWYKDPDSGEIMEAWGSAMEFVGRNLGTI